MDNSSQIRFSSVRVDCQFCFLLTRISFKHIGLAVTDVSTCGSGWFIYLESEKGYSVSFKSNLVSKTEIVCSHEQLSVLVCNQKNRKRNILSTWSQGQMLFCFCVSVVGNYLFYPSLHIFLQETLVLPASWSSGNAFVSGARDLRFKYRAGQIGHIVANGSPPLRHFFEKSCVARAQCCGDKPRQLITRFGVIQRV